MTELYLVQRFSNDKWKTFAASTYEPDAIETFEILRDHSPRREPLRQVTAHVTDLDFLLVHARDVKITNTFNM